MAAEMPPVVGSTAPHDTVPVREAVQLIVWRPPSTGATGAGPEDVTGLPSVQAASRAKAPESTAKFRRARLDGSHRTGETFSRDGESRLRHRGSERLPIRG